MRCVSCRGDAEAICRFCGRAVCLSCATTEEFRSGTTPKYFTQTAGSAIVVKDAIWCRQCTIEVDGRRKLPRS
ncbi:hypothetical protein [Alienimonas californiensis]|uniref:Uncharacterized protein n=1 Tax=Alienimonas californiensis TaxID=2527989 RepID=A0A517P4M5_9PLAN|nr:hypothetical protein [Alienimonas californiensis]QDT14342.1 hypothetical protein CA12_04140 [Alienimonas californiensis]